MEDFLDEPGDWAWLNEEEAIVDVEPEDDIFYEPFPGEEGFDD